MSQKKYYIDDFKVRNCTQYGEYGIIDDLNSGDAVRIEYDTEEKMIIVKAPEKNQENESENNRKNKPENNQEYGPENNQKNESENNQGKEPENNQKNESENNQGKEPENNQKNESEVKWKTFGELEVPEQMRKILVPLLRGSYGSMAFKCKINIADKKVVINERLQLSVWAANDEEAK